MPGGGSELNYFDNPDSDPDCEEKTMQYDNSLRDPKVRAARMRLNIKAAARLQRRMLAGVPTRHSPRRQPTDNNIPFIDRVLKDFEREETCDGGSSDESDCDSEDDEEYHDDSSGRIPVKGPWVPRPGGSSVGSTWSILHRFSEDDEWTRAGAQIGGEPVMNEVEDGKGGCRYVPTGDHYITIYYASVDDGWYDIPSNEYRSSITDGFISEERPGA